jgi:hypothetical protein
MPSELVTFPCTDPEVATSLETDGFCMLPGWEKSPDRWKAVAKCPEGAVNYTQARGLLNDSIARLNRRLGWDCYMIKYRISPGCNFAVSNSTDAAALHRDVQVHAPGPVLPVFTFVIHMDHAKMKCVPGSHKHPEMSVPSAIAAESKRLEFKPGDAMVFHACMLHGGVFENIKSQRYCVQCFDVFPTPRLAAQYAPRVLHVWCDDETQRQYAQKNARLMHLPVVGSTLQYAGYLVTANGYGARSFPLPEGVDVLSGEVFSARLPPEHESSGMYYPGNLYVRVDPMGFSLDASAEVNAVLREEIYNRIYQRLYLRILLGVAGIALVSFVAYRAIQRGR